MAKFKVLRSSYIFSVGQTSNPGDIIEIKDKKSAKNLAKSGIIEEIKPKKKTKKPARASKKEVEKADE